jgi:hypothetical protein
VPGGERARVADRFTLFPWKQQGTFAGERRIGRPISRYEPYVLAIDWNKAALA